MCDRLPFDWTLIRKWACGFRPLRWCSVNCYAFRSGSLQCWSSDPIFYNHEDWWRIVQFQWISEQASNPCAIHSILKNGTFRPLSWDSNPLHNWHNRLELHLDCNYWRDCKLIERLWILCNPEAINTGCDSIGSKLQPTKNGCITVCWPIHTSPLNQTFPWHATIPAQLQCNRTIRSQSCDLVVTRAKSCNFDAIHSQINQVGPIKMQSRKISCWVCVMMCLEIPEQSWHN